MPARFTLDTNLYVDASRDAAARAALARFSEVFAPWLYLTGIVAQELRAGVRPADERRLERELLAPFERRGRLLAPGFAEWNECGDVMRRLSLTGPPLVEMTKSLVNDIHLALTCRAHGVRLVTRNTRDIARVSTLVPGFTFDAPWPTG